MFKENLGLWVAYNVVITTEYHNLLDEFLRFEVLTEMEFCCCSF